MGSTHQFQAQGNQQAEGGLCEWAVSPTPPVHSSNLLCLGQLLLQDGDGCL
jgi:hypothetical protein